jgi:hypothetical protein
MGGRTGEQENRRTGEHSMAETPPPPPPSPRASRQPQPEPQPPTPPPVDLHTLQMIIDARRVEVDNKLKGLRQILEDYTLTDEEKTSIQKLIQQYEAWQEVLMEGTRVIRRLVYLGFPELPTQAVPQSMLDALEREAKKAEMDHGLAEEARKLFRKKEGGEEGPKAARIEIHTTEPVDQ